MSTAGDFQVTTPLGVTDVVIGDALSASRCPMAMLWDRIPDVRRIGLVIDANVADAWPEPDVGDRELVARVIAPAGEAAKTREVLASIQDAMMDLRRSDVLIAVGGGAVLDVAGFAAATIRRGVPWIALATSVVAMADAAIGGKVAINHKTGKNMLGTFHPPRMVCSNVAYLTTLPPRERVAGLAEVYKCAVIAQRTDVSESRNALHDAVVALADGPWGSDTYVELVTACARLKGRIVERDERDHGERRLLNFGHTVGHALERILGNEALRHGEAVAIGMVVAAHIAASRGDVPSAAPARMAGELSALSLPTTVPAAATTDEILRVVGHDKKRSGGAHHTFVLPIDSDDGHTKRLAVVDDVTETEIRAAIDRAR